MKLLAAITLVTPLVAACGSEWVSDGDGREISTGVSTLALTSSLKPVAAFGSNPGGLKLFAYAPTSAKASAPLVLVLVLQGCTQGASDMQGLGWNELADQYGFVVGYPEQTTTNNSARCFNWGGIYGDMSTLQRNKGENASLKQIVDALVASHSLDAKRVFIVGSRRARARRSSRAQRGPTSLAGPRHRHERGRPRQHQRRASPRERVLSHPARPNLDPMVTTLTRFCWRPRRAFVDVDRSVRHQNAKSAEPEEGTALAYCRSEAS